MYIVVPHCKKWKKKEKTLLKTVTKMIDETQIKISTSERVNKHIPNKVITLSLTYHNRKEHYSKVLGVKQVFTIVIDHLYNDKKNNFKTILDNT